MTAALVSLPLAAGVELGCRTQRAGSTDSGSTGPVASGSGPHPLAPQLAPLTAEAWRIELPVEGFGAASVAVPLGAREPRPLVVALHGHADRPDWQCGTWTGITRAHSFVLCPRGVPLGTESDEHARFTFKDVEATERELRAALTALKKRFGAHLAPGPVVLAGYSLGAARAARIARLEPSFFSRLVLIEGAFATWSAGDAGVFAHGGGQKLMAVCTQASCRAAAERAVLFSARAGVDAEVVHPGDLGHVFDGRVAAAIRARMPWLIEGDTRWPAAKENRE